MFNLDIGNVANTMLQTHMQMQNPLMATITDGMSLTNRQTKIAVEQSKGQVLIGLELPQDLNISATRRAVLQGKLDRLGKKIEEI